MAERVSSSRLTRSLYGTTIATFPLACRRGFTSKRDKTFASTKQRSKQVFQISVCQGSNMFMLVCIWPAGGGGGGGNKKRQSPFSESSPLVTRRRGRSERLKKGRYRHRLMWRISMRWETPPAPCSGQASRSRFQSRPSEARCICRNGNVAPAMGSQDIGHVR